MGKSALLGATSKCKIGTVACDAVVNEVHSMSAQITTHPVESGSSVADHYRKTPNALSIQGIISRTPIATGFPGQSTINSVRNLISGSDPVLAAWEEWETYMEDATPIAVTTGKKTYPEMLIVDLNDPRVTNDWMRFEMVLATFTTAFTTSVEAIAKKAEKAATVVAQKKKSKGAQAAAEKQDASILASLLGL